MKVAFGPSYGFGLHPQIITLQIIDLGFDSAAIVTASASYSYVVKTEYC